ncbi:hypothetical protein HNR44_001513 [Geomicrobium halophilum]|uniref:Uncharacterized protein n=1 Tax=Geomicrobium halophilum TaxID=549000 RepID=A0A841PP37_9BACL|nr:hypothetical protein [Geomicrobium halophilum]MBB6449564.1 hypothetical protein [Geomicrobium halophilum]
MSWDDFVFGNRCGHQHGCKFDRKDDKKKDDNDECDCHSLFKNISKGTPVVVFLKGGNCVKGDFVDIRGDLVDLALCYDHKVKVITICCDDISAVSID